MLQRTLKQKCPLLVLGGLLAVNVGTQAQRNYENPDAPSPQPSAPGQSAGQPQAPGQPGGQTQARSYDSDTLDNFVSAYNDVQDIHGRYMQKLENTDDPSEATELQREAQNKIQSAVEEQGLSINEYHQIVADYRGGNPDLRKRINERMQ